MFDSDIKILNLLFKIMPFVFWKGRDGRYLGGNDNQAHAFGFSSPDDFIGKTIFEIIEQNVLKKHMQMCLLKAAKSQDEEEILTKIEELQNIIKNYN
jgi:hypothetical protein